jgi:hypothetical protein
MVARKPVTPPLDDAATSRLARELARDIKPLKEILQQFHLSEDQFDKVVESSFFQIRLAEETQLWNASDPLTIRGRIETKAATMVEDMLLEAYTLFHDRNQPMAAKVEMLKWAARVAGLGDAAGVRGSNSDNQVKITINIAGKELAFDKEKLPERVIDADVVQLTPSTAS